MKKMRKAVSILLAGCLVLGLSACGGTQNAAQDAVSPVSYTHLEKRMAKFICNFISYSLKRAVDITVIIPSVTFPEACGDGNLSLIHIYTNSRNNNDSRIVWVYADFFRSLADFFQDNTWGWFCGLQHGDGCAGSRLYTG